MIKLTQKEFDLLELVAKHEATETKPFKVVSVNNGALSALTAQGLVETRPKNGNALMLEVAIKQLGYQVVNNEVDHEIVTGNEQTQPTKTETVEEQKMEQVQAEQTHALQPAPVAGGQFVLEDNIPIPDLPSQKRYRESSMQLERMEVGQSFLVPFKEGEDVKKGRKRVSATVSQTKKRKLPADSTAVFVVYPVENGYRVWRKA